MTHPLSSPTYQPSVFNAKTIDEAKGIILTPDDYTTNHRWRTETPYLADMIVQMCAPHREPHSTEPWKVLDFGVGIGRIAKELIDRKGAFVSGFDISDDMLRLSLEYLEQTPHYQAVGLEELVNNCTEAFDTAICIWTMQHILSPGWALTEIHRTIRPGGQLFLVNLLRRAVPTDIGFVDDGLDIAKMVRQEFSDVTVGGLDPAIVGVTHAQHAYWLVARK